MPSKRTYLVRKMDDAKEPLDVKVDAEKFDALLEKLTRSAPKTNVDVLASRPKKADKLD